MKARIMGCITPHYPPVIPYFTLFSFDSHRIPCIHVYLLTTLNFHPPFTYFVSSNARIL
jgi:hypothetical protein